MLAPFYLTPPPASSPVCRGDIYEFVPILWLNPPVHVLRNWQQGTAEVLQASRVKDAFNAQSDDPVLLDNLRHHQIYNAFYLPPEAALRINESYADFRRLQPLHRDFLEPSKRCARLAPSTMQAMLAQFSKFMLRI
jgi:hypothetical protein